MHDKKNVGLPKVPEVPKDKPVCFRELVRKYGFEIEIPLIQREFAFGRDEEEKKRKSFIGEVLKVAYGRKDRLLLDFIFGTVEEDGGLRRFVPLDGQQRLTVLLLFTWYFSRTPLGIAFRFPMRRMANSFVEQLVAQVNECGGITPSEWLSSLPWFMPFWRQDATVSGMLAVLDEIHRQADDSVRSRDEEWLNKILFYVKPIPAEEMQSDNAYVKMNARGLPLSKWEKIKARISESLTLAFDKGIVDNDCKKGWAVGLDGEWREKIEELSVNWCDLVRPKDCKEQLRYVIDKADHAWMRLVNAVVLLSAKDDVPLNRFVSDNADVEDYSGAFDDNFLRMFPRVLKAMTQFTSEFERGWTKDRSRNLFWSEFLDVGCVAEEVDDPNIETLSRALFQDPGSYANSLRLYAITKYTEKRLTHGAQEAILTVTRVLNLIDNSTIGRDEFPHVRSAIDAVFDSRNNIPGVKGLNREQVEEESYKLGLCPGEYFMLERNNFLQGSIDLFRDDNRGYSLPLYNFFVASFYPDKNGLFDQSKESFRKILRSTTDDLFRGFGPLVYPRCEPERWLRMFRSRTGRRAFKNMFLKCYRDDNDQTWGVVNSVFDCLDGDRIGFHGDKLFFITRLSFTKTARRVSYDIQEQKHIDVCEEWVQKNTTNLTLKERLGQERLYLHVDELGSTNPCVYRKSENGNEDVCIGTLKDGKVMLNTGLRG